VTTTRWGWILDLAGAIEQWVEERFGGSPVLVLAQALGQKAVPGAAHQGEVQIAVHLQTDPGRERIARKAVTRFGEAVVDEPALGRAGNQRGRGRAQGVGQQPRRLLMAAVQDGERAERLLALAAPGGAFVQDPRRAVGAPQALQGDPPPSRGRSALKPGPEGPRSAPQGQTPEAPLIQALAVGIGGQRGVKDPLLRGLARRLRPKVHEA
jgi:hypothetical protein